MFSKNHSMDVVSDTTIDLSNFKECVVDALKLEPRQIKSKDMVSCLTEIIFGSRKTRLNNSPTPVQVEYMREAISKFTQLGQPIEGLTMWGSVKGYAQIHDHLSPDLLDIMALRRFCTIQHEVSSIYSPGIEYNVVLEDVTENLLSSPTQHLKDSITIYKEGLQQFLDFFNLTSVHLTTESEILKKEETDFSCTAKTNADVLYKFWEILNAHQYQMNEEWPETKAIRNIGWRGDLPKVQWDYYFARSRSEFPDIPIEQRAASICLYFGISLARRQFNILKGKNNPPLKLSLSTLPPGVPEASYLGRVEYKVKDTHNNHSIPPWAGFGRMTRNGPMFKPVMIGIGDARNQQAIQTTVTVTKWAPTDYPAMIGEKISFNADICQ